MTYELTGLDGRVAVVTGAGRMRSIGRPIAVALARAGCDIVLTGTGRAPENYPDDEKAAGWGDIASVADEVRAEGRRALPVVSDVSDPASVEQLVALTVKEFGRVDIVINNAGAARGSDRVHVVDLAVEDWNKVINVNLTGTFLMSKYFARQLIAAGNGGSIINISSIAGRTSAPDIAAYASSKAAIQAFGACLATELGEHQIRVNSICPGVIDTYRMDDLGRGETWNELIDARIPLGRAGLGDDIAHQVVYLCSDQGNWITAQTYTVDGGTAPSRG